MADGARLGFEQPGNHALGADRVVGVSVVVSDIEAAQYLYGHQLDLASASSTQGVAGESASYAVGDFRIDLVQPTPESRAGRFMAVYGEGLHQVYLRVASLAGAKAHLAEQGVHCVAAEGIDGALAVPASRALGAELILCEA
jgi:4-hydroxyphenylpyruvate dioxygenase-like putative hemolysin